MAAVEGKRLKLEVAATHQNDADNLPDLLQRLVALLRSGGGGGDKGLDALLDELGRLQATLNGAGGPAFKAIADAQQKLQAAIVALQAAVDRLTPPPGYRPPAPTDEAGVRALLSYAHRLSYTSSAPMSYVPGQQLPFFFKPPAPQEGEMRLSQLHAFAREWEERQQAQEAQRQAAARAVPAAPAAAPAAPAAAAAAPAGDLAALAAQAGLDVQQLLASMPPGWKPGDPIPLLPAAAAAGAAAAPPPAAAAAPPPAPSAAPAAVPAAPAPEREASPEGGAAPAAPRLAGIFLNELSFEEFEYVSDEGEESDSEEEDSEDDE